MKKSIAKKTVSVSHAVLGQVAAATVVDPAPTATAPSPPAGYVSTKVGRGNRPQRAQVAVASKMATELRAYGSYAQEFGSAAPDPSTLADALETAANWSGSLQNAAAWYQYVKQQEYLAWKHALGLTDSLRVPFEFQMSRDASVGESLPSTAKFFAARMETGAKAAATRKKAAAEKAAANAKVAAAGGGAANGSAVVAASPPPVGTAASAKLLS